MRWPWERRATEPDGGEPARTTRPVPARPAPSPQGWAFHPPLQRTIAPLTTVHEGTAAGWTATGRDIGLTGRMSHVVSESAWSGLVDGDGGGLVTVARAVSAGAAPVAAPPAAAPAVPTGAGLGGTLTRAVTVPGVPVVRYGPSPGPLPPGPPPAAASAHEVAARADDAPVAWTNPDPGLDDGTVVEIPLSPGRALDASPVQRSAGDTAPPVGGPARDGGLPVQRAGDRRLGLGAPLSSSPPPPVQRTSTDGGVPGPASVAGSERPLAAPAAWSAPVGALADGPAAGAASPAPAPEPAPAGGAVADLGPADGAAVPDVGPAARSGAHDSERSAEGAAPTAGALSGDAAGLSGAGVPVQRSAESAASSDRAARDSLGRGPSPAAGERGTIGAAAPEAVSTSGSSPAAGGAATPLAAPRGAESSLPLPVSRAVAPTAAASTTPPSGAGGQAATSPTAVGGSPGTPSAADSSAAASPAVSGPVGTSPVGSGRAPGTPSATSPSAPPPEAAPAGPETRGVPSAPPTPAAALQRSVAGESSGSEEAPATEASVTGTLGSAPTSTRSAAAPAPDVQRADVGLPVAAAPRAPDGAPADSTDTGEVPAPSVEATGGPAVQRAEVSAEPPAVRSDGGSTAESDVVTRVEAGGGAAGLGSLPEATLGAGRSSSTGPVSSAARGALPLGLAPGGTLARAAEDGTGLALPWRAPVSRAVGAAAAGGRRPGASDASAPQPSRTAGTLAAQRASLADTAAARPSRAGTPPAQLSRVDAAPQLWRGNAATEAVRGENTGVRVPRGAGAGAPLPSSGSATAGPARRDIPSAQRSSVAGAAAAASEPVTTWAGPQPSGDGAGVQRAGVADAGEFPSSAHTSATQTLTGTLAGRLATDPSTLGAQRASVPRAQRTGGPLPGGRRTGTGSALGGTVAARPGHGDVSTGPGTRPAGAPTVARTVVAGAAGGPATAAGAAGTPAAGRPVVAPLVPRPVVAPLVPRSVAAAPVDRPSAASVLAHPPVAARPGPRPGGVGPQEAAGPSRPPLALARSLAEPDVLQGSGDAPVVQGEFVTGLVRGRGLRRRPLADHRRAAAQAPAPAADVEDEPPAVVVAEPPEEPPVADAAADEPAAATATAAAQPDPAQLAGLVDALLPPLLRRLRHEILLDRERRGVRTDRRWP